MIEDIARLEEELWARIQAATTSRGLEEVRVAALG